MGWMRLGEVVRGYGRWGMGDEEDGSMSAFGYYLTGSIDLARGETVGGVEFFKQEDSEM